MSQVSPSKRLVSLAKFAVSLGLLFLLYRRVDLRELADTLLSINPMLLLIIYGLFFLNTSLSAFKWRIFLTADGVHIPLLRLIASYLIATFFNLFLPSSIGGDVYRVYDVRQYSQSTAQSLSSVLADRLTGFLALTLMGMLCAVAGYRQLSNPQVVLVPLVICAAIVTMIWLIYQQRLLRFGLRVTRLDRVLKLKHFVDKLLSSFAAYRQRPRLFYEVMLISILFQACAVVAIYLVARALGIHIPLLYFFIFVPLITLMEALPISIYGLGIRDATYVLFFAQVGHTEVEALSMALAYVVITVVYSLVGGVVLLFRPKRVVL